MEVKIHIESVTPKQGRVVLFDGGLYHTAEQPIKIQDIL